MSILNCYRNLNRTNPIFQLTVPAGVTSYQIWHHSYQGDYSRPQITCVPGDVLRFFVDAPINGQYWTDVIRGGDIWLYQNAFKPNAEHHMLIPETGGEGGEVVPPVSGPGTLSVSPDGHFLRKTADGTPFFFLADTAWALQKLSQTEVNAYMNDRAAKGFNVLLGPNLNAFAQNSLGYQGGVDVNNNPPFINGNTDTPNEPYWLNIDYIVNAAASRGLMMALVIMWGDEYPAKFGTDSAKAARLGHWIGARYSTKPNIIWIVSGEYGLGDTSSAGLAVFNAMGAALKAEDTGKLATIHPIATAYSSDNFHNQSWLDFNMIQSSHFRKDEPRTWLSPPHDFALTPAKPTVDGEICYEETPVNFTPSTNLFTAFDVRKAAYRTVFSGGMGLGYGNLYVFQFYDAGDQAFWPAGMGAPINVWQSSINSAGAGQMRYLRTLMESRSYFNRVADQSIITSGAGTDITHRQATRAADGSYIFVYIPDGTSTTIDMTKIVSAVGARASWYDPRTGVTTVIGDFANSGTHAFVPPTLEDWVLILDRRDSAPAMVDGTYGSATKVPVITVQGGVIVGITEVDI